MRFFTTFRMTSYCHTELAEVSHGQTFILWDVSPRLNMTVQLSH